MCRSAFISTPSMSLVQRVTPIEGADREQPQLDTLFDGPGSGGYGTVKQSPYLRHQASQQNSLRRVISYNAFSKAEEFPQTASTPGAVTAYNVSTARRLGTQACCLAPWKPTITDLFVAQVCFTVLACWLASGIVFGFAALKPVLIDQDVYRESCSRREIIDDVEVCFKQDLR